MTTNDTTASWLSLLTAAGSTTRTATRPAALAVAGDALRLAWATTGAARAGSPDGQLWWLRLAEAIAETADELELVPGAPLLPLGTGPTPDDVLTDTPAVQMALLGLLTATRDALTRLAGSAQSGAEKLAATLAADAAARAVTAGSP